MREKGLEPNKLQQRERERDAEHKLRSQQFQGKFHSKASTQSVSN